MPSCSDDHIASAWEAIYTKFIIRVALNAARNVRKLSLDVTPQDAQDCLQPGAAAAFSFVRAAILAFKENDIEEPSGKRGALILIGTTASTRDNVVTSAFAASKLGTRALSQSLAKECGKKIFVSPMYVCIQVFLPRFDF